jgi:hypothetical protein
MANAWFETVAVAQRRAKRRLPALLHRVGPARARPVRSMSVQIVRTSSVNAVATRRCLRVSIPSS